MTSADKKLKLLLDEGSKTLCLNKLPNNPPKWFDNNKFKRGQKVFHKYIFILLFAKYLGLVFAMCLKKLLAVLSFTNSCTSAKRAYKRFTSTIMHACIWYDYDLDSNSKLWKSLEYVARMHNNAANQTKKVGLGEITQEDMVLTQFAFFGFTIVFPDKLGLKNITEDEFDSLMHVWRTIGYMLGIEDRFNLCGGSVAENIEYSKIILEKHLKILFYDINHKCTELARYTVEGLQSFIPDIEYEATFLFLCKLCDLKDIHEKNACAKIIKTKRTDVAFNKILLIQKCYPYFIFRVVLNSYIRFLILMQKKFPILGYINFGYEFKLLRATKYIFTIVFLLGCTCFVLYIKG